MATNSFQEGMQSGAALFAPFAQAQAQVNQLRIAQQQELARRLFAQQQLQQQLAARQELSDRELAARREISTSDQAARERLQNAQQLFAAQEAAKAREATATENEFKRDFENNQLFEAQEAAYNQKQEAIENQTKLAKGAIEKIGQLNEQARLFLQPNSNDYELAIAQASSFVDAPVKRLAQKDETAEMYAARASQKDPEWAAEYRSAVASIVAQKADSPALQQIQDGIDLYSGMVSQAVRGGLVDASVFSALQQPQAQAAGDQTNVADFADSLNALLDQGQQQEGQVGSASIPATSGLVGGISSAVKAAPKAIDNISSGLFGGIGNLVFGKPEVTSQDLLSTKDYAIEEGLVTDENQFNSLPDDAVREINQKRIQSNAAKKTPKKNANPFLNMTPGMEVPFSF